MEKPFGYKWVVVLFFGVVGMIFGVSLVYLVVGNVVPDTYWGRKMTPPTSKETGPVLSLDKHVLERGRGKKIGNRIFYFKGHRNDHILFEVIIPEIDRQYPYPFKVRLADTKNGFEVAGIRLALIALRPNFVSVKEIQ